MCPAQHVKINWFYPPHTLKVLNSGHQEVPPCKEQRVILPLITIGRFKSLTNAETVQFNPYRLGDAL